MKTELIDKAAERAAEIFDTEIEHVNQKQLDFAMFLMTGEVQG